MAVLLICWGQQRARACYQEEQRRCELAFDPQSLLAEPALVELFGRA